MFRYLAPLLVLIGQTQSSQAAPLDCPLENFERLSLRALHAAAPPAQAPTAELRVDDSAGQGQLVALKLDVELNTQLRRLFCSATKRAAERLRQALVGQHNRLIVQTRQRLRGAPHYVLDEGVALPLAIEVRLSVLAQHFYRRSGRRLWVTSGSRSAEGQARAMLIKLHLGARLRRLYRQRSALREIERVYRRYRYQLDSEALVSRIAAVITGQMRRGVFLSPHLRHGAVDIRSRGMQRRHRWLLLRLARRMPWIVAYKLERRPPHFHLEFDDRVAVTQR